jgi:hypothetical protein
VRLRTCSNDVTPDAELRLWSEIETLRVRLDMNRLALGKAFLQLRNLYSERSADNRRTSGHGIFMRELKSRGFNPRTLNGTEKARKPV